MAEDHPIGSHKAAKDQRHRSICIIIVILLLGAAASAWMIVDARATIETNWDSYVSLGIEARSLSLEAASHRTTAAVHRMALMDEAVREAPSKDVSVKRLGLSIAMASNGTGFEDRFLESARQGTSKEELESMRTSFLTSLFENYPPALERQEGIQMQMDAVMIELQAAGTLLDQSERKTDEARETLSLLEQARNKEATSWKTMIGFLLLAALVAMYSHSSGSARNQ